MKALNKITPVIITSVFLLSVLLASQAAFGWDKQSMPTNTKNTAINAQFEFPKNETTCNSCEDCSAKLNGDWNKVTLTASIDNRAETCIVFGADNITFDGGRDNGYHIDGTRGQSTYGIDLSSHSGITIINTEIKEFYYGIKATYSMSIAIKDSHIHHNSWGIVFGEGNGFFIQNNVIKWNDYDAINGVNSNFNIIKNNEIATNFGNGIITLGLAFSSIIENEFIGNANTGLDLASCNGNIIHHNNFIGNNKQALDNGANNWNTTSEGNYWDDYSGSGPYYIPGGNNADYYPSLISF